VPGGRPLLREMPNRIKACAHPDCVLHFYDTWQVMTDRLRRLARNPIW
jgi:hypothetical protein